MEWTLDLSLYYRNSVVSSYDSNQTSETAKKSIETVEKNSV